MSGSIPIIIGLSVTISGLPGGSGAATYYILAENGNKLTAENGLILRTEQN